VKGAVTSKPNSQSSVVRQGSLLCELERLPLEGVQDRLGYWLAPEFWTRSARSSPLPSRVSGVHIHHNLESKPTGAKVPDDQKDDVAQSDLDGMVDHEPDCRFDGFQKLIEQR
jgi:hypothetical protein